MNSAFLKHIARVTVGSFILILQSGCGDESGLFLISPGAVQAAQESMAEPEIEPPLSPSGSRTSGLVEKKVVTYAGKIRAQALFILDNSGSMTQALAGYINSRLNTFFEDLIANPNINFELGFTTTNDDVDRGILIAGRFGEQIVTRSSRAELVNEIQADFRARLNAPGSGVEQGLQVLNKAVLRDGARLFPSKNADESLSRRIVIISDADDTLATDSLTVPAAVAPMAAYPGLGIHPIVAIPGKPCTNPPHEEFGYRFQQSLLYVPGEIGSICQEDFDASLDNIFAMLQNFCVELSAAPAATDNVKVLVSGTATSQFTIQGKNVCLVLPPGQATVEVQVWKP